jgi:hypothetical protein
MQSSLWCSMRGSLRYGLRLSLQMADGRRPEGPLRAALWQGLGLEPSQAQAAQGLKALVVAPEFGPAGFARLAPLVAALASAGDADALTDHTADVVHVRARHGRHRRGHSRIGDAAVLALNLGRIVGIVDVTGAGGARFGVGGRVGGRGRAGACCGVSSRGGISGF